MRPKNWRTRERRMARIGLPCRETMKARRVAKRRVVPEAAKAASIAKTRGLVAGRKLGAMRMSATTNPPRKMRNSWRNGAFSESRLRYQQAIQAPAASVSQQSQVR